MSMLQIRNVPEAVHRALKARAALAGMSLSEFALMELRRTLERPTRAELLERLSSRPSLRPRPDASAAVRRERG